ncbi:MAG: 2-hydroxyacyl-CoA dehydratase [Desulfobacterales bacterium]|jgi:benzoyl-CoA reductase/2-hydroxyglutaryl-CoA dehydratase subunit BcrC/BadD/HgdB|nr:2-hydroxyacyl-CoA dehydratase [Desulfobacterales bacterium]
MATKVTTPGKKNLQTTLEIGKAIRAYYEGVKEAKSAGKPVIWSYGLVPREIFHAADAPVLYLEHLPLMIGAKQLSGRYIQLAEEEGFSRDVCAFHRCFLGCAVAKDRDPYLEKLFVSPDLIIASNLPCMSESKSFLYAADHHNCPYYFLDAPINTWGKDIPDYAIEYFAGQLQGAIDSMEEHGFKVDMDKLKESINLTKKMMGLWNEIDNCRKTVPTPMSTVDGITAAYPLIQLPGTQLGVTLFERLLEELKEKVEKKQGVIEDEKLRLMWFGVPPFYNMGLFNYVEKYGAVVVKSMVEYIAGGAFDPSKMDPKKPLESLAYKALVDIVNPTYPNMVDFIVKAVEEFKIDGLIGVVKRSCGLLPGYMRLVKDAVYKDKGIPTSIFDLDGLDIREYDDVTSKANLDSFVESLLASKRRQ